ncbi:MAG TPA: hypothetical protein VJN50_08135 [Actinomycetota bacterium]|nr:hypothetical protein [Actinomycetota bacterium]
MRALLEFLGIAEPGHKRREPVALPTWARWMPVIAAVALGLVSVLAVQAMRALV